jgi:AraC-like DNA-binding protein
MRTSTVSASIARALLDLAVSKGADYDDMLHRSGIRMAELEDPDNRVALARFKSLMRAGQMLCNDPALALHLGAVINVEAIGCFVGNFAETGADGLALMNRFARLNVEVECTSNDRYVVEQDGEHTWLVDTRTHPDEFHELTEYAFARLVCSTRARGDANPWITAVQFTHDQPSYFEEYHRVFQMPIAFGCAKNRMLLRDDAWLAGRMNAYSPAVLHILSEHAELQLAKLEADRSVRGQVETLLTQLLQSGEATVEVVAARLACSRQTLFRRLKDEGTTYAQVVDDLKHRLALHYLLDDNLSVSRTASILGFSEPASFSRAFKRWTGSSPRDYAAGQKRGP